MSMNSITRNSYNKEIFQYDNSGTAVFHEPELEQGDEPDGQYKSKIVKNEEFEVDAHPEVSVVDYIEQREQRIEEAFKNNAFLTLDDRFTPGKQKKYQKFSPEDLVQEIKNMDSLLQNKMPYFSELIQKTRDLAVKNMKELKLLYDKIDGLKSLTEKIYSGKSGTYFANDLVISPFGEGVFEIHNDKGFSDIFNNIWVVDQSIRTYEEVQRKVAAYRIAEKLGFDQITPPTVPAILEFKPDYKEKIVGFHYFTDRLDPEKHQQLFQNLNPSYKKVCAVQKKIEKAVTLYQLIESYLEQCETQPTTDEMKQILDDLFPIHDYMLISAWVIVTGDNDANLSNLLAMRGSIANKLRLMKIDEGQAFPRLNRGFRNEFMDLFGHADKPLEISIKLIIKDMDLSAIDILQECGLEETIPATRVRVETLKELVEEFPNISIRELYYRISKISFFDTTFKKEGNPCFADLKPNELRIKKIPIAAERKQKKMDYIEVKNRMSNLNNEYGKNQSDPRASFEGFESFQQTRALFETNIKN